MLMPVRFSVAPVRPLARRSLRAGQWLLLALEQIDRADAPAARRRVQRLRARLPGASTSDLVEQLIREKCRKAAVVGAASAGAGIIPGLGTLAALTLGTAAGIGALRLQAELVLEIAAAHGRMLDAAERRRALLVAAGVGAGADQLLAGSGRASLSLAERYGACWVVRAIPVAGMGAAAAMNAASTYLIGQRAHAYFGHDPPTAGDWRAGLRALSGLDDHRLAGAAVQPAAALRQYLGQRLVRPRRLVEHRSSAQSAEGQGLPARKPPSTAKTWPVA
jgi:hypothetical protein